MTARKNAASAASALQAVRFHGSDLMPCLRDSFCRLRMLDSLCDSLCDSL